MLGVWDPPVAHVSMFCDRCLRHILPLLRCQRPSEFQGLPGPSTDGIDARNVAPDVLHFFLKFGKLLLSVQVANFQAFSGVRETLFQQLNQPLEQSRTIYCLNWKVSGIITYSLYRLFREALTVRVEGYDVGQKFPKLCSFGFQNKSWQMP